MKKRNVFVMASAVHLVLWGILLTVSAIDLLAVFCFPPTDRDMPLGYALEKGISVVAAIVAAAGVLDSVLLFFSVRWRVAACGNEKHRRLALCLSLTATAAFYGFFILLFVVNRDWIAGFLPCLALVWLACMAVSGVLLLERGRWNG